MEITIKQIEELWSRQAATRSKMETRRKYYEGKHAIVGRNATYADGVTASEIVTNWAEYAIDSYVGALTSTPYQVTVDGEDGSKSGVEMYAEIAKENQLAAADVENLRNALVCGFGVETHEFVGGKVIITSHDPLQWLLLWDADDSLVAAVRRVALPVGTVFEDQVLETKVELMTVYLEDRIEDWVNKGQDWVAANEPRQHAYGRPPVVVWRVNRSRTSIITDALIGQMDEYNDIDTITGDDIRNNTNSKLTICGCDANWLMDNAEKINKLNMLPLPEGASAEYLTKGNDVERVRDRLQRTRDHVHTMFKVPDIQAILGATGAASGIALRLKFQPMMHRASSMINWLKAGVEDRIALINAMLRKARNEVIEGFTVTIQFVLPTNRTEEWQAIGSLKGVVSHRTQLELLSDIDDPERELEEVRKERPPVTEEDQIAQSDALANRAAVDIGAVAQEAIQVAADGILDSLVNTGALERLTAARQN
ncbi:MAG: hypothetical protein GHCLOJNM_03079 [bacterium]|nr:hypothetical protein [bacterium]